jgi:hypothetical protein
MRVAESQMRKPPWPRGLLQRMSIASRDRLAVVVIAGVAFTVVRCRRDT